MPPKSKTALNDNEKCFAAIFSQIISDGKAPKFDYDKLAEDLTLPSPAAARTRWGRIVKEIKDGTFGDLKIASASRAHKRTKDEADIEDGAEGLNDVVSPTKKHKTRAPRKKAGGAGGKAEKEIKEEQVMDGEGSGIDVSEDSGLF